jgi:hypothetical protein
LWGTFQDRLVSELRLARAKTKPQAQKVLERYLPVHNRRFSNLRLTLCPPGEKSVPFRSNKLYVSRIGAR